MELTGYKERLRRAYLRARKLNLSSAVQERLFKEFKGNKPVTSNSEALESDIETLQDLSMTRLLSNSELDQFLYFARELQKQTLVENILMIQSVRNSVANKDAVELLPRFHRPIVPDEKIIAKCLFDVTLNEKKFISSYIRIAPWIHYFSSKDSYEFRALKKRDRLMDPCLRRIHSAYKNLSVQFPPAYLSKANRFHSKLLAEVPSFFPTVPENSWGKILASFNQLLAFNHLQNVLETIRDQSLETNLPFKHWFEHADKEIKINWYQVQSVLPLFTDEEITKLLIRFMTRFTSLACRDGSLSLWTLSQEGAPPELLCDLESWFLRDTV